jgi:hypothetical protein
LRADQGHAVCFVEESLGEHLARQGTLLAGKPPLLREESERGQSNLGIVGHRGAALF